MLKKIFGINNIVCFLFLITASSVCAKNAQEQAMSKAVQYFNDGNKDEAINELNAVISANPKSLEAYAMRERIYYDDGKYDKAGLDAQAMIGIAPNLPVGYHARARINLSNKNYKAAIADLNKVIELAPELASAYNDRASVYLEIKEYILAWKDARKASSLGARNSVLINRLEVESGEKLE